MILPKMLILTLISRKYTMDQTASASDRIKAKSLSLGFLDCGIVPAGVLNEDQPRLKKWLENGMHGKMQYMERNLEKRTDPGLLVENAQTVVVVLQNYYPQDFQHDPKAPVLSKYAYGTDYHFVMKDKLRTLFDYIRDEVIECNGRIFVDSAPVLERAWARKAGLGWIGKNAQVISPVHGSFFFIGELILDVAILANTPEEVRDHCGRCTRCLDACPTQAILNDRVIDARKCISYQTIENRDEIDATLVGKFENRVFGCDICQDVCPWNLKSEPHSEPKLNPKSLLMELKAEEWFRMDHSSFNEIFRNSAVKRAGYRGIQRNLRFLQSNTDDSEES